MSTTHIAFVLDQLAGQIARATAQGNTQAVVVTDEEIATGRAGLFGRWGGKVQRYPLARLRDHELIHNPSCYILRVYLVDPAEELTVMFPGSAKAAAEEIAAALRPRRAS